MGRILPDHEATYAGVVAIFGEGRGLRDRKGGVDVGAAVPPGESIESGSRGLNTLCRTLCQLFPPPPRASPNAGGRGKKRGEGRPVVACLPQSDSSRRRGGITGVSSLYRNSRSDPQNPAAEHRCAFAGASVRAGNDPTGLVPVGEEEVRKDARHISHLLHPRRKGVGVVAGTGILPCLTGGGH